jgi:hypothetical protein
MPRAWQSMTSRLSGWHLACNPDDFNGIGCTGCRHAWT